MFMPGLDDKWILNVGMAYIEQIAMFVQKANLQFVYPPRIFASIGHATGQPDIRLCSRPIQPWAKHKKVAPMPVKAAPTTNSFIRGQPANYPNRQNDEKDSRSSEQQLLSPQRIPTLFGPAKRANLRRHFDCFSAKAAEFGVFVFSHSF